MSRKFLDRCYLGLGILCGLCFSYMLAIAGAVGPVLMARAVRVGPIVWMLVGAAPIIILFLLIYIVTE